MQKRLASGKKRGNDAGQTAAKYASYHNAVTFNLRQTEGKIMAEQPSVSLSHYITLPDSNEVYI